jgi:PIN domain nuclease of toxin-antitoxin system
LNVLLDTHIFLWAINESDRLSSPAREAIQNAANEVLAMLEKLPHHHRDPFDRLLLAQCLQEDAMLITVDRQMRRYAVPIIG